MSSHNNNKRVDIVEYTISNVLIITPIVEYTISNDSHNSNERVDIVDIVDCIIYHIPFVAV